MSSWRTLLLRVGDKCPEYGGNADFKDHIDTCYSILWRELEHSRESILNFFLQCAEQIPHKIPFYAVLVGLLNSENEEFGKKIVESTEKIFQDALFVGNCSKIRLLMRFLTALMSAKVLQPSSIVELFETLLSSAATTVDEENGNPFWQSRADFYVFCILSCLPWGGAELWEQVPEEIERVMAGVEAYLRIRKPVVDDGFSVVELAESKGEGRSKKDFLEDLWVNIESLSSSGWKAESVPKPHLLFEAQLVTGKSHELGSINCPAQPERPTFVSDVTIGKQRHEAELKYPRRIQRLHLFAASKFENIEAIDRFIVEEYLLDILLFFNGCRKECASYLASLPVPFRYEYLMAETIFSQLLYLPHPPFKPMYYTLVIMDLCKALPGAFPGVVAAAVRSLFEKIAYLDMECRTRLVLWFSHHLANFQFIWPWEEWASVLDLPKWSPQRVFVQEVLEREVRLSYWEKIKQSVENASGLESLMPPNGGNNFRYSSEDGAESAEQNYSKDLNSLIKEKKLGRDVTTWVEENIIASLGLKAALEIVIHTLLEIGSKSFTHLVTVLERYGQVIARTCPDQDMQVQLINEVSLFWKNNAQMAVIAIDRMMGYRLISNLAIVEWIFSSPNVSQFHTSDRPWEILRNAVNKTYNRIRDLRKEIPVLERNILSAETSAIKAEAALGDAESRLELVRGEPVQAEKPAVLRRLKSSVERAKQHEASLQESLKVKRVLLDEAMDDIENLFILLYKKFAYFLMEHLPRVDGGLSSSDSMLIDSEQPGISPINIEGQNTGWANGDSSCTSHNVSEEEQWCRTTIGYVKAFSRQYADEIWLHIEKLDAEVFTKDLHALFVKAVFVGICRPYS